MDTYDPYKIAQQQAYAQAQQQTQDWAGVANNPSGYMSAASTPSAPVPNSGSGAVTNNRTKPNYPGKSVVVPAKAQNGTVIEKDNWTGYKNNWWGSIPQATFGDIINDPEKYTRMWADAAGVGENTERAVGDFAPMPVNYLYGMGLDNQFSGIGVDNPMQMQATLQDKLFDRILRGGNAQGDNTPAEYLSPKKMMQTALSAFVTKDASGNYSGHQSPLAMQFGDPAVPPATQADNFIKYVASTVGNLIPRESATAYINVLNREKDLFGDYVTKNPTVNITFNKWVRDRLGPNGGL